MQVATTGTESSNITIDLTRTDSEYLVQISHWFWIVWMTEEQREALSTKLSQISNLIKRAECDPEETWLIINLSTIRDHREPLTIDEYIADLEKSDG